MTTAERVLVVDDEPQIVRGLKVILRRAGYEVEAAETKTEALDAVSMHPPDAIVLDLLLPEVWGPAYEEETHYLRVHVTHIRAKIEPDSSHPRYLLTEPGVGYRLREPS